MRCIFHHIAG